jgi:hypothetical protein
MDPETAMNATLHSGGKAVLKLEEGVEMPLFLYGVPYTFMEVPCHLLVAIQHIIPSNELEIRGRMRFETTGNKSEFAKPQRMPFNERNLELMKEEVRRVVEQMETDLPFIPQKPHFELNFRPGESVESVIKKMNDSNEFNIGVIDQQQYKNNLN